MNLLSKFLNNPKAIKAVLIIIFATVAYFFAPPSILEPARRILFVFIIASLFWAFEIVPLYATSMLVVLLEIILLCRPGGVLGMDESGYKVFLLPFASPIIILFFGGFVLASAFQKYAIDKFIATHLLKLFGNKPYFLMLGFMLTTALLSMWMSNTATTAMMVAMILPLLKQLDKNDPFRTGLILAIPFAANIGGMATPVGTPPNAIALGILADYGIHLTFIAWMKMAVPLSILLLGGTSILLYTMFPSHNKMLNFNIPKIEIIGAKTKGTMLIAVITILLWLTSGLHGIPSAVIALFAAGMFSLTGLLNQDDFKNINWDILILMWGGLALGKGMQISGLTDWVVSLSIFQQQGFILVAVFCLLGVVLSTFMSNTATSNLLIPIVMVIPGESSIMLATTIALACSLAMALPVSTPPNAIAFSTNMLKSKDMLKAGTIVSLVSVIMIILGFKFFITRAFGLE
ncbi:Sodium-dependent anion transporter family [hydrothermal vent metagenome]|uniref:Sodium-dependent anion transporter family n=1 Tax=hydrothermal vent metagenome TaxID=652676 RepID=A0A3B1DGE4_9ZZZZ